MKYYFLFLILSTSVLSSAQLDTNMIIQMDTSAMEMDSLVISKEAQFPGGNLEMLKYIQRSLVFPNVLTESLDRPGTIYMFFTVEKDGSLSNIRLRSPISKEIDQMFIDIFRKMPVWEPGVDTNGRPVRLKLVIPIYINWQ